MVQNLVTNVSHKEDIEYIVPKTFIEKFKMFFYYKYTIPFMLLILVPYYSLLLIYGYITNRAFFNAQISDPTMYGIVPIFLAFTSLNRYMIYKVADLSKSKKIEKIFKNETLFDDWRKNLYAFMTNNKILVPLTIIFS